MAKSAYRMYCAGDCHSFLVFLKHISSRKGFPLSRPTTHAELTRGLRAQKCYQYAYVKNLKKKNERVSATIILVRHGFGTITHISVILLKFSIEEKSREM
jgi:hypothetical protein